ncbi:MAG: FAD-dependent oxidoreductase [Planctomycetes bacterium]|nr:FAD-dependent oxidoreductase [Planctomycetota bacterium]MBL7143290.1 FAD-dependent oxidoreductase [Phycisphaerae bacterium]
MAKKILIVGGVAGGASAAARLRRLDEKAEIIMFERGPFISFANCGLPYYIGGTIKKRENLLLMTPEQFNKRFNIDVRINNEVIKIDRDRKLLEVKDLNSGNSYFENYDKLILSPGAEPSKPPIEGIDSNRIFTLRNLPDMDRIDEFIKRENPKRAVVVGAGYIGLEMAENLRDRGMLVAIVEMTDQVMPVLDREMANLLNQYLQEHSIALWLSDAVSNFRQTDSHLFVGLKSGMELCCDFAVLAIGVKPEVKLAEEAVMEIGSHLGIKVNEYLQTSDPDIYAIGDAIEVKDLVLGNSTLVPLAGPANKQGRMAADNICGKNRKYNGTLGTSILKLFDQTVAITGAGEKALKNTNIDYEKLYIHPANHVGYYPGAKQMHIKMLFSKPQGKILGVQIVGTDGVDRRIDIFAVAIRAGMTVFDLQELDLAYAPPYGSGKDAVNMAGFAASNILDGTVKVVHWNELDNDDFILDVRTKKEFDGNNVPRAINIPLDELRESLELLPKDKVINVYCGVGIRSYIAVRILMQNGFEARNISGGFITYSSLDNKNQLDTPVARQLREEFCLI